MIDRRRMSRDARVNEAAGGPIVLFDGHCNLCSGWVRFVLAREGGRPFRFAPLQSDAGARLLAAHGLSNEMTSVVLIDGTPDAAGRLTRDSDPPARTRALQRSAAVAAILRRLRAPWPLAGLLLQLIPRPLRDAAYDLVARRRYRWFGRQEVCALPSPARRDRFLA